MGFESMPKNKAKEEEGAKDTAVKHLEFLDKNGVKTSVAVFENETDEEALERARSINARLGDENTF